MCSKNIFSLTAKDYLQNKICIDSKDLIKKINTDLPESFKFFNTLIEYMIGLEFPYQNAQARTREYRKNRKYINKKLYDFLRNFGLNEYSKEHFIFDNIRHAFLNFKEGGILQMYQGREAEKWYPKVIIKEIIGVQKDINELDNEITIYRGTSNEEFNSKKFGQSWSREKNIAHEFAFVHYRKHQVYQNTMRVIMQTTIKKENIYYYQHNGRESEVIINRDSIDISDVKIIKKNILTWK